MANNPLTAYVIVVTLSLVETKARLRGASEDWMDEEKERKRTTKFSRAERNKRIVERAREGFSYDEIAREEQLTERSVYRILTQALQGREALFSSIHAHMQIDRVGRALRVAGDGLNRGDVRAVAPFLKAVEKLDRYQSLASQLSWLPAKQSSDDDWAMRTVEEQLLEEDLEGSALAEPE